MKNIKLYSVLFVLIFAFSMCTSKAKHKENMSEATDREMYNLKGDVRSLVERHGIANPNFVRFTDHSNLLSYQTLKQQFEFENEHGGQSEEFDDSFDFEDYYWQTFNYSETEGMPMIIKYEFDKKGNQIMQVNFEYNMKMIDSTITVYNENNKMTCICSFDANGQSIFTNKMKYDELGNMIESEVNNQDFYLNTINKYIDTLIVSSTSFDKTGKVASLSFYKYDDCNHLINNNYESTGYSGETEYQYDKKGNCVLEKHLTSDGEYRSQVISEYNKHGKVVKELCFDRDSNIYTINLYEYNRHLQTTSEITTDKDGNYTNANYSKYDKNGNLIENEYIEFDEGRVILKMKTTDKYNDSNLLLKETVENLQEIYNTSVVYEYDDSGNLLSQKEYNMNDLLQKQINYILDDKGNWIEQQVYEATILGQLQLTDLITREIEYY